MIEVVFMLAVLGFAVVAGVAYVLLVAIPRSTSPERKHSVRIASRIIFAIYLLAAVSWVPSIAKVRANTVQDKLDAYCATDKEQIFRRVVGVRGLLVVPQSGNGTRGGHFHVNDKSHYAWLGSRSEKYQFVEIYANAEGSSILRYDAPVVDAQHTVMDQPTARYAVTWAGTTRISEGDAGLFGEEVIVYDRSTGEVLARRIHHYVVKDLMDFSSEILTCPNIEIGEDSTYIDRRPRSSYAFVSRVLMPAEFSLLPHERLNDWNPE